jgi:hypothetical protein
MKNNLVEVVALLEELALRRSRQFKRDTQDSIQR